MTVSTTDKLRIARTNILVDLAAKNGGKVTPEVLLATCEGSQKLLLNILWNARRSGYVNVDQVRNGRKIEYWVVTVTGEVPTVPVAVVKTKIVKTKIEKTKAEKPVKVAKIKSVIAEDRERIKAANLAKMKAVTAKLKKAAAKKKKKKTIVVDDVEKTFGSTGEVGTSFTVDGGWDSMENVNVRDFLR